MAGIPQSPVPLRVVADSPARGESRPGPPATPPIQPPGDLERDLARGLIAAHTSIGSTGADIQMLATHLYALTELLIERGTLSLHELDARKSRLAPQMAAHLREKWVGARMLADDADKYDPRREVKIDCAARVHLCQAACCKFGFFLSRQDLEEGAARWDVARPYHISQDPRSGACVHHDPATRACQIHDRRPLTCRVYDCRNDARIWADFDRMIPSPNLGQPPPAPPA